MPPEPTPLGRAGERKRRDALERAAAALALDEHGEATSFQARRSRRRRVAPMALRPAADHR